MRKAQSCPGRHLRSWVQDVRLYSGARWQPFSASEIVEKAGAMGGDPSATKRGEGSRIVVDATRQWPEEGGPNNYSIMNRSCLTDAYPDVFTVIDDNWSHLIDNWKQGKN